MTSTLLAGPIVRRVTKNRVCVWLATSRPVILKLEILNEDRQILAFSNPADLKSQSLAAGKNLHIYLLQARPIGNTFPVDGGFNFEVQHLTVI